MKGLRDRGSSALFFFVGHRCFFSFPFSIVYDVLCDPMVITIVNCKECTYPRVLRVCLRNSSSPFFTRRRALPVVSVNPTIHRPSCMYFSSQPNDHKSATSSP